MNAEKLGPFIANIRKEKGMTQIELATKLNLSDKTISKWERGAGIPDIGNLEPLAAALEISLVELMRAERSNTENISILEADILLSDSISLSSEKNKFVRWIGTLFLSIFAIIIGLLIILTIKNGAIVLFSVGSIGLGLIAWSIPVWNITQRKTLRSDISILISLTITLISVILQVSQTYHDVITGDWSAIEDTIYVQFIVIVLFSIITFCMNFLMLKKQNKELQ